MGGAVTSVGGEGADEGEGAHDDAKLAGTKVVECVETAGTALEAAAEEGAAAAEEAVKAAEVLTRLGEARDEGLEEAWEEAWEEVEVERGRSIAGGSTSRSQSLSAHQ